MLLRRCKSYVLGHVSRVIWGDIAKELRRKPRLARYGILSFFLWCTQFTLAGAINALFWPSFLFLLGCGCLLCSVKEKWDCSSSSSGGGTRNRTRSTPSSTREGQQTDDNISEVSVTTVGQLSDRITTNGTGEDKPPNYNDVSDLFGILLAGTNVFL